jgi:CheY-like chemotaxis protein
MAAGAIAPVEQDKASVTVPTTIIDRKFVLVVEDKPFNQTLIAEILEMRHYQVEIIGNGQTMLNRLNAPPGDRLPDLVLMDIQLPEVDGFTLTQTLKQNPAWQQIPVIAITALAMAGDRDRCLAAGADDYLSKPLQIKELEAKLDYFLHQNSP